MDGFWDYRLIDFTWNAAAPPQSAPGGGVAAVGTDDFDWMDEFLPPDQAREYRLRLKTERSRAPDGAFPNLLDQVGPPNMLLVNRGGVFEPAPENKTVGLWRNSLQATWADYDRDGDLDLLVAGDTGGGVRMAKMYRNEGNGFFEKDVLTGVSFSYADWGDYDNDGDPDLALMGHDGTGGLTKLYRNDLRETAENEDPGVSFRCPSGGASIDR